MSFDLIIEGGTLVTMDGDYRVLEDHCLGIKNSKIEAIFPCAATTYTAEKRIDGRGCLIIPGLINAHSHLGMTYFRGLADDLPLDKWLHEYIWPLEAKLLTPQFVYDATLHGAAEMIKNGISLTSDMYFHMSSIADACSQAGLRVIIGEALIDHQLSKPDGKTAIGDKIKQMKVAYQHDPLIDFSLAPHAIYTCSRETLQKCAEVARDNDFMIHMHLSETREEALNCQKEHGKLPVAYLHELGLLKARIVLAHGIWLEDSELELLAAHGKSSVAICTESNLKLTSGFAPLKQYLAKGINMCLGTDGVASNNNLDLLAELSVTAKLHKALSNDPTLLPARDAFAMITINAARAIGRSHELGSLEVGKLADIAVVQLNELETQPMYNPYSHLVYAVNSHSVRDLFVNGKPVMLNRQLCNVDEAQIISRAKDYKNMILKEINP